MCLKQRCVVLLVVFVAFASLPTLTQSVRCYNCDSKQSLTCENFDASSKYHMDCPNSDMCLIKVLEFELQNSTVVRTFERGCVPQEIKYLKFYNGKWQEFPERISYKSECSRPETDDGFPIEYCRCKGDLCNKTYYAKN